MPRTYQAHFGLLFGLAAVVAWSSALVGISFALRQLPPGPMVLMRFCVASSCFAVLLALRRIRLPRRRDVMALAGLGVLGHAIYQIALAFAQTRISAGTAGVVIALVPALSAALAIPILKERLSLWAWSGMGLAFAGVVLISVTGRAGLGFQPMILLALLSAAASAGYFVLQKPWLTRYSALEMTAYGIWAGTLVMLPLAHGLPAVLAGASLATLLAVIYLGIVPTAIGYTLWSEALSRAPAARVSSLLYFEPVITFILAWFVLGEHLTVANAVGGACVLVGMALVHGSQPRSKEGPPELISDQQPSHQSA